MKFFFESISTRAAEAERSELMAALAALTQGDTLVITKLDRLGRTQVEVINRLHQLQSDGIHVQTLDGLLNTAALGRMAPLVVGLLTGLAEVERELIRERTLESIAHRRATGGNLGGRRKTYNEWQVGQVKILLAQGLSLKEIGQRLRLSKSVVFRISKLQPEAAARDAFSVQASPVQSAS